MCIVYYILVSVGPKSGHSMARFSAQGVTGLKSGCPQGCRPHQEPGAIVRAPWLLADFISEVPISLLAVSWGASALPHSLPRERSIFQPETA